MTGGYKRTLEVRAKQSETMKRVMNSKSQSDWDLIEQKRIHSFETSGKRRGRPPSRIEPAEKACPTCTNLFVSKSKYCTAACYHVTKKGKCPVPIEILKTMDRSYMRTESYRLATSDPNTKEYTRYRRRVNKLTHEVYLENVELINPNLYPRTVNGVEGGWQLDHIVSVRESFEKDHPPEFTSRKENLQMLRWEDNIKKGRK